MADRITDREMKTATKMAKRKSGVTRAQLADKLSVPRARAGRVLDNIGAKGSRPKKVPTGAGVRTLVFTV